MILCGNRIYGWWSEYYLIAYMRMLMCPCWGVLQRLYGWEFNPILEGWGFFEIVILYSVHVYSCQHWYLCCILILHISAELFECFCCYWPSRHADASYTPLCNNESSFYLMPRKWLMFLSFTIFLQHSTLKYWLLSTSGYMYNLEIICQKKQV